MRQLPRPHPVRSLKQGFVLEITILVIGLFILILALVLIFAFASRNRQSDGENVAGSDRVGELTELGECKIIPADWTEPINRASSQSGVDTALLAAIFAAGEHRYYQSNKWPAFMETPPYPSELNPQIHDHSPDEGYVRGPVQFKESTFQAFRRNLMRDATPSRFGGGFKVEPYIEQVTSSLIVAGNYLAKMGGKSGANETKIKRAIFGYYNGETNLRKGYDPNHEYVRRVFPAYSEYSSCRDSGRATGTDIIPSGEYAPILPPQILRRFIPIRPHHGPGTLASDPASPAMDIAVPTGTQAFAFTNGTVITVYRGSRTFRPGAGGSQSGSCGNGLRLKGNDGKVYQYCHFDKLAPDVVQGAKLKAGQFVGHTGNTGRSTGPHLHFGVQDRYSVEVANDLRRRVEATVQ